MRYPRLSQADFYWLFQNITSNQYHPVLRGAYDKHTIRLKCSSHIQASVRIAEPDLLDRQAFLTDLPW